MSTLPQLKTKYGSNIGVELFIQFPDLTQYEHTFFDADEAAGQTSLSANGTNFSANDYVVLGNPGAEKTEIVKLSGSSATTLTSTATVFAHNRGDLITFIPYNQIVVSRSTDSGVTYTPLTAVDLRPDATETYIQRTSDASTDYYKFRFYNSTSALYSAYSDETVASGFADNSVWSIKHRALNSLGEELGGKITDEFLNEALWEGRREVDQDSRVMRWSFRTKFNTDIGNIVPGTWSLAVPTDLRDKNTHKNVLALRVGRNQTPLDYQDVNRFNQNYLEVAHTTLATSITGASTSLVLASSGDFDESGLVDIAASSVAETVDSVDYTANNEVTNTLSGVTGIDDSKSAGVDIWQGTSFGEPGAYTIHNETLYFDVPFEDDLAGENIYADYYQELQASNSDADVVDEPEYDMYIPWLRWKVKYLKSNGTLKAEEDGDYKEFKRKVDALVTKEITGQLIYLIPE